MEYKYKGAFVLIIGYVLGFLSSSGGPIWALILALPMGLIAGKLWYSPIIRK
jgi:hypothetical protein